MARFIGANRGRDVFKNLLLERKNVVFVKEEETTGKINLSRSN